MPNPYEIPEEPYYMMDELIEAFKSKSLVVCHMHRQLTIDALTSHGYFKRVNPSEDDIEAFKRAGSGKHLPSAFKYPSLPDSADVCKRVTEVLHLLGLTALSVKWFNTRAQIQRNHKGRPEAGMGMTGTIELKVTV